MGDGAWNGRGTGYLYVPIPMDVETWKVTLTFSSPVTNLQVWDGLNIECTGHVCTFENQGYNEVQSAGTQLKIDFLMDFVSELPDLVGLTLNDVDVCTEEIVGPTKTKTKSTTTMKPTPTTNMPWQLTATKDEISLVDSNQECRTSLTNDGGKAGRHYGQLDAPCKFPFKVNDKTFYTCTYYYSHLTDNKPWCSVDTDENNNHHNGPDRIVINGTSKKFYGICDDQEHCNIPPRIPKVTGNSTLLLVAGGYSSGGPINDIELISGENNTACSKSVNPIFDNETFYEGDALGMTGQFTKEAAIICGGKNRIDNLNTCYEYNPIENEWFGIPSMEDKRYNSASAIIKGNLWIIGGSDGWNDHSSDGWMHSSKITETYEYKPNGLGKWNKDFPLPIELEKSGINSQCVVTLNSSSVFMAGGYQDAYRIITNETIDEIEAPIAGGKTLSNSWMFDGSSWKALAEMSTPRDRPACSLMHMNDGSIRVLVAGGCKG